VRLAKTVPAWQLRKLIQNRWPVCEFSHTDDLPSAVRTYLRAFSDWGWEVELGLEAGKEAYAVVKASDVMVAVDG
jgi:hypothetical protein